MSSFAYRLKPSFHLAPIGVIAARTPSTSPFDIPAREAFIRELRQRATSDNLFLHRDKLPTTTGMG
jgi:hypothetical protein